MVKIYKYNERQRFLKNFNNNEELLNKFNEIREEDSFINLKVKIKEGDIGGYDCKIYKDGKEIKFNDLDMNSKIIFYDCFNNYLGLSNAPDFITVI